MSNKLYRGVNVHTELRQQFPALIHSQIHFHRFIDQSQRTAQYNSSHMNEYKTTVVPVPGYSSWLINVCLHMLLTLTKRISTSLPRTSVVSTDFMHNTTCSTSFYISLDCVAHNMSNILFIIQSYEKTMFLSHACLLSYLFHINRP